VSTILKTGPAPHIRTKETVESVMYDVVIALVPAFLMAIYSFGVRALILTSVSVLTCVVTEYLCQKALKRDIEAFDGSAILTGILFSFVVPAIMPLQYVVIGNIVAITLGKMVYGGLGHNIFNPALVGRAFVQASWPVAITTFAFDGKAGIVKVNVGQYVNIGTEIIRVEDTSSMKVDFAISQNELDKLHSFTCDLNFVELRKNLIDKIKLSNKIYDSVLSDLDALIKELENDR